MITLNKASILLILSLFLIVPLSSCSTTRNTSPNEGLPLLTQDELIRPYVKLGRIQVTREVFWSDYSLSPDIKAWGLAAVKHEAVKMGADAIMFHEVTGRSTSYGIIPATEYRATGFAIKFK